MKIRCDVCEKAEATVFCSADEAALCSTCDRSVHHANKLAGKHLRFSFHHHSTTHSSKDSSPLCDICQERRAFLFCREDRAILCRECDVPIHAANELTRNHNRFLLTGVKLSAFSAQHDPAAASCGAKRGRSQPPPPAVPSNNDNIFYYINNWEGDSPASYCTVDESSSSGDTATGGSASSISEYLENLPGWRVDDFLDPPASPLWTTPYM